MLTSFLQSLRYTAPLILVGTLLSGCLSSTPNPAPAAPTVAPSQSATARATGSAAAGTATVVSQAQPGFSGKVIAGTVTWRGGLPPPGSSLFLGLVKSADDPEPRTCIDSERDPVNDQGQFYAQVSCNPQAGDQLKFVLVIGPAGERNWHTGVVPLPADLSSVSLDAPE